MKIAIVSGYFAVPHRGHLELFKAALKETEENDHYGTVAIIVNNDAQTLRKHGFVPIFCEERIKFIQTLDRHYDGFESIDEDESVAKSIEDVVVTYTPHDDYSVNNPIKFVFINSGDRNPANWNPKEVAVCEKYGVEMKFLDLPKVGASSELIKKISDHAINRFLDRDIDAS